MSGSNLTGPIYMGCAGKVFDVTGGASFYGPGGAYGGFAGTDASRGLAKMDLKPSSFAVDDLGPAEKNTLKEVSSRSSSSRQHKRRRTGREGRAAAEANAVVTLMRSQHCGRRCALPDPRLSRFRRQNPPRIDISRTSFFHSTCERNMRAYHAINCSATPLRWACIDFILESTALCWQLLIHSAKSPSFWLSPLCLIFLVSVVRQVREQVPDRGQDR